MRGFSAPLNTRATATGPSTEPLALLPYVMQRVYEQPAARRSPQRGQGAECSQGAMRGAHYALLLSLRPVRPKTIRMRPPSDRPGQATRLAARYAHGPDHETQLQTSCSAAPRKKIEKSRAANLSLRLSPETLYAAFSSAASHLPSAARPFMRARWAKARWPAATFSGLPPQALRAAACSARP